MIDTFRKHGRSLTSPPEDAAAILPDDAAELAHATRALYVGGGGDLRLRLLGGAEVTLVAVPAGTLLPLRVARSSPPARPPADLVGLW